MQKIIVEALMRNFISVLAVATLAEATISISTTPPLNAEQTMRTETRTRIRKVLLDLEDVIQAVDYTGNDDVKICGGLRKTGSCSQVQEERPGSSP